MRTDLIVNRRAYLILIGVVLVAAAGALGVYAQPKSPPIQGLTAPPVSEAELQAQAKQGDGHADPMQVVNALRTRVEANPHDEEALFSLANSYMMIRSFDKAEELYKRLLKMDPKKLDARTNYALIKVEQKNYDEAIKLLQANLALAPDNAESVYNIGMIYAGYKNQSQQAIALWEGWLKANSGDTDVVNEMKKQLDKLRQAAPVKSPA